MERCTSIHDWAMTDRAADIILSADAAASIHNASWAAMPRETGGILIGWRGGTTRLTVTVLTGLVVSDPAAAHTTYELNRDRAQAALDAFVARRHDPNLGYVGEWHSHPAPQPPSSQDLRSLRASARLAPGPIALVVAALTPALMGLTWHGRVAERRGRFRRIDIYATDPKEQRP
jgi:integrative and conjugative element protein (TIGR02256 family)